MQMHDRARLELRRQLVIDRHTRVLQRGAEPLDGGIEAACALGRRGLEVMDPHAARRRETS
jgi:hypothetical protein